MAAELAALSRRLADREVELAAKSEQVEVLYRRTVASERAAADADAELSRLRGFAGAGEAAGQGSGPAGRCRRPSASSVGSSLQGPVADVSTVGAEEDGAEATPRRVGRAAGGTRWEGPAAATSAAALLRALSSPGGTGRAVAASPACEVRLSSDSSLALDAEAAADRRVVRARASCARLLAQLQEARQAAAAQIRHKDAIIARLHRERLGMEVSVARLRGQLDSAGVHSHDVPVMAITARQSPVRVLQWSPQARDAQQTALAASPEALPTPGPWRPQGALAQGGAAAGRTQASAFTPPPHARSQDGYAGPGVLSPSNATPHTRYAARGLSKSFVLPRRSERDAPLAAPGPEEAGDP